MYYAFSCIFVIPLLFCTNVGYSIETINLFVCDYRGSVLYFCRSRNVTQHCFVFFVCLFIGKPIYEKGSKTVYNSKRKIKNEIFLRAAKRKTE